MMSALSAVARADDELAWALAAVVADRARREAPLCRR